MNPTSADWLVHLTGPSVADVRSATLVLLLLVAAVIDVRTLRIPNWLTVTGALIGLALSAAAQWQALGAAWALDGVLWSLAGLGAGLALMLPFYALHVMGAGDVKLMAMVGALLGLPQVLGAVVFSLIAGGASAVLFVLAHRRMARFSANIKSLLQGATLSVIAGVPFAGVPQGASAGKLPYGVSICAGTVGYLAARQLGYL